MTRLHVPTATEMITLDDEQLTALAIDLQAAIASCNRSIAHALEVGKPVDRIKAASLVYEKGLRNVHEVQRVRRGEPAIEFCPARPVHNWITAFHSLKAVNRLLGLCQAEHEAVDAWLNPVESVHAEVDDEAAAWERLERAHAEVERALRAGS